MSTTMAMRGVEANDGGCAWRGGDDGGRAWRGGIDGGLAQCGGDDDSGGTELANGGKEVTRCVTPSRLLHARDPALHVLVPAPALAQPGQGGKLDCMW